MYVSMRISIVDDSTDMLIMFPLSQTEPYTTSLNGF